jgi:hypothetical protein
LNPATNQGEQRVIAAAADANARMEVRTVLAHNDLACADDLTAEPLYAKALRIRVAAIPAGRCAFLVSH